jgi:hypothetical protein
VINQRGVEGTQTKARTEERTERSNGENFPFHRLLQSLHSFPPPLMRQSEFSSLSSPFVVSKNWQLSRASVHTEYQIDAAKNKKQKTKKALLMQQ